MAVKKTSPASCVSQPVYCRIIFCFSSPDEKEGLAVSLKESSRVIEEAKEREGQMHNKLKALEQQVKVLTERDHEVEVALRSESLLYS